jgi:hypothetical protein
MTGKNSGSGTSQPRVHQVQEDNMAYLRRRFARLGEEAVQSAQQGRLHVMSNAAQQGALHGSRIFLLVKEEYVRAAKDVAVKMARLAYDVTGSTDQPVRDGLTQGLTELRAHPQSLDS